jgi:hypothetical protein
MITDTKHLTVNAGKCALVNWKEVTPGPMMAGAAEKGAAMTVGRAVNGELMGALARRASTLK